MVSEFVIQTRHLIHERMKAHNWRSSRSKYSRKLSSEAIGTVGLVDVPSRREPALQVGPVIGVRHEGIENKVQELCDSPPDKYAMATIFHPLGYLMPENRHRVWHFGAGRDAQAVADEMIGAIEQFGVPWMSQHATLEPICEALEIGKYGYRISMQYRTPVALALVGRKREAVLHLQKYLKPQQYATGDGAAEYRAFADRFVKWMGQET